jgi:hypothetical protein
VDELFPTGDRYYMKSHFTDELCDAAIATLLEHDAEAPTPECLVAIRTLGGAVARVAPEESAFPHRQHTFNVSIDAGWTDPALDGPGIAWARDTWNAMAPFATGDVYVNFSGLADEADALRDSVYGRSVDRLGDVRATHDPVGLFATAARQP